ncbi:hypothetical protein N7457_000824 [Penicillium paradoxum]|uniref:uncharacterized protein n=1 Tax=Penicillium paradoxum TaxID=176176 RepID=UPI00254999D9|nr:uncharacterized protein N7457_000824 [Penicillium paradoxum]KAJ5794225.1 hypothetical protein N7457_000824 [Penicillium paradoxum]
MHPQSKPPAGPMPPDQAPARSRDLANWPTRCSTHARAASRTRSSSPPPSRPQQPTNSPHRANWRPGPDGPPPTTAHRPGPGSSHRARAGLRGHRRAGGCLATGAHPPGPPLPAPRALGTVHATPRTPTMGLHARAQEVESRSPLHRLTDHIWVVKVHAAVNGARNWGGGNLNYGGGPCTTKIPYKMGGPVGLLSDFLGTWSFEKC